MAHPRGRCTNLDYCTLADQRRTIECPIGEPFICPECRKALKPPPTSGTGRRVLMVSLGLVVVAALVGVGVFAGLKLSGRVAPMRAAPAALPLPAPAPASQAAIKAPAPVAQTLARPAAAPPPPSSSGVLLRLDGPAGMAASVGRRLAEAYLTHLGDLAVVARAGATPGTTLVSGVRTDHHESIAIVSGGPDAGFSALAAGKADIGVATRRITQPELERLKILGTMTSPQSEHLIGLEAVAVIVSPQNRVASMTRDQVGAVFRGTIRDWSQLGSGPGPIHVLARQPTSGTAELFRSLALANGQIAPVARIEAASADMVAAVAADPAAIGFTEPGWLGSAKPLAIADTGNAPVGPTSIAIAAEDYPLTGRLYLYNAATSANPLAARFAAFATSAEGQGALAELGVVPLHPRPPAPPLPQTPVEKYRTLVAGATRLSVDLHFQRNSVALDIPSMRSIDRVWNMVMSDHTTPDHIVLIGFADNIGDPAVNLALSQKRVAAAAAVFEQRGLTPGTVVAFGSDLPIADNATEEGREKNRRVEVYLRN